MAAVDLKIIRGYLAFKARKIDRAKERKNMTYRFPVEFQEIDFETAEKIIQKKILDKKIEEIKSALAYYGNVSFETMEECFKIVKYQSYGFEYVDSELTREYAKEVLKNVFKSFRS